jgi:hypothetical protein
MEKICKRDDCKVWKYANSHNLVGIQRNYVTSKRRLISIQLHGVTFQRTDTAVTISSLSYPRPELSSFGQKHDRNRGLQRRLLCSSLHSLGFAFPDSSKDTSDGLCCLSEAPNLGTVVRVGRCSSVRFFARAINHRELFIRIFYVRTLKNIVYLYDKPTNAHL